MSFDPVSYIMGAKNGGGGYDEGYAKGYTDAQMDLLSKGNQGMVVYDGSLLPQSEETYTENGTYNTTLINSVEVDVPTSPSPPGPQIETLSGTLSNPWDFIDLSDLTPGGKVFLHAYSLFRINADLTALQMGLTEISLMLTPNPAGNFAFSALGWVDNTDYQMMVAEYDETDGSLVTLQALMNGSWIDLTAYASVCPTTAYVVSLAD